MVFQLDECGTVAWTLRGGPTFQESTYNLDGHDYPAAKIDRGGYAFFSEDYRDVTLGRSSIRKTVPARNVVLIEYGGGGPKFNRFFCRKCGCIGVVPFWQCEASHMTREESREEALMRWREEHWSDEDWDRWYREMERGDS